MKLRVWYQKRDCHHRIRLGRCGKVRPCDWPGISSASSRDVLCNLPSFVSESPSKVVGSSSATREGRIKYNNTVLFRSISIPNWEGGESRKSSIITGSETDVWVSKDAKTAVFTQRYQRSRFLDLPNAEQSWLQSPQA